MRHHEGWHQTHPSRWETFAWITLQALAVTGIVAVVVVGVFALSVIVPGIWQ